MSKRKKSNPTREQALEVARYLGCSGAHQREDGVWLPCASEEEMQKISNRAETQTRSPLYKAQPERKRRKKKGWEQLRERGVASIDTLSGGGLVSGKDVLGGSRQVRASDPDTFTNPESARVRSRQLGCIGIRRYNSTTGTEVWLPCSNESDYRRRMGIGPQARRDKEKEKRNFERRIVARLKKQHEDWYLVRGIDVNSLSEKATSSKGRSNRQSATPALPKERVTGSSVNSVNSAASVSSGSSIEIAEATVTGLVTKARNHNKRMSELDKPEWSKANLGALKSVWRRGAGAFSVSHRPGMTRQQWAMARVNAFLRMLEKGKPDNLRYISDVDLLPESHPWKKNSKSAGGFISKSGRIGRSIRSAEPFDPDAVDGDNDGIVQDSSAFERPATPKISMGTPRTRSQTTLTSPKSTALNSPDRAEELGLEDLQPMTWELDQSTAERFGKGRGRGFIKERVDAIHSKILEAMRAEVKHKNTNGKKRAIIIGGPVAVGKSTLRTIYGPQVGVPGRDTALHLDPDEIRELLPEYRAWKLNPMLDSGAMTHGESMHIVSEGVKDAIKNNLDVVHDTTGRDFRDVLTDLDGAGYEKVAHYATGDLAQAVAQADERARATGRWRSPDDIRRSFRHMPSVIQGHINSDTFDEFNVWDTTKRPPVHVAQKIKGKPLQIFNQSAWTKMMNGGK